MYRQPVKSKDTQSCETEHKIKTIIKLIGTDGLSGNLDDSLSQAIMDIALVFAINGFNLTDDQLQIFINMARDSDKCSLQDFLKLDLGY